MHGREEWVLVQLRSKHKRPVRPMFPDYLSVSYDYPLVEFIHNWTAFYHLPISLVLFTHWLIYTCLQICSSWTKLHNELVFLKEIFLKNGNPEDFINKCFKKLADNIYVVKETTPTIEEKPLVLVLSYLSSWKIGQVEEVIEKHS